MKHAEHAKVAKAAGIVGMATMLSRIFGFIRDMVVAAFFGAGVATDAFFVAFRIPNMMRRLLGEGSLTVAFVPVFTEYLTKKSKEEAIELANVVFTILSIILVVLSLLGVIFAPLIVKAIAFGFDKQFELAVFLTRIMFPYIFFICLVALCMGILNSLRHFAAPALSPVILNVCMILATLLFHSFFAIPIVALAIGVMIGGILQLAMQWPFLLKMGVRLKLNFNFQHPGLKQMGKLFLMTLIGSSVYQFNVFIGTVLASLLPQGSVSYLYYADRILELPLGVFAIAVGTATLPSLSKQAAEGSMDDLKKTLSFSLRLIFFITVPATVALIMLRIPILSALFQRGAFNASSTLLTAQALLYYALGLWAFSAIRVIDAAFFALQDRKSPVIAAIVALAVNIAMSIILMYPLKHGGLALATSLASAVNVFMLSVILWKKIGPFLDHEFYRSLSKVLFSSIIMGIAIYLTGLSLSWNIDAPLAARCFYLAACICLGIIVFFTASVMMRNTELLFFIDHLKRKISRK